MHRLLAFAFFFISTSVFAAVPPVSQFAWDLYGQLRTTNGNLFLSPASIYTALAMVYVGARGKTAEEIGKVLHSDQLAGAGKDLASDRYDYKLVMANSLWGQKGYEFLPEYLKTIEKDFGSSIETVDFKNSPDESRKQVNLWVEKKTEDKIKNLLPPSAVTKLTRLILVNAIYFKAPWEHIFDKTSTRPAPFWVDGKKSVKVQMMRQTTVYGYAQDGDVEVIDMPYKGNAATMMLILPKKRDGLAALEKSITAEKVAGWTAKIEFPMVVLEMPRFKVTGEATLARTLEKLGIKLAFTDDADFTGMAKKKDLVISEVIHKAWASVDEKGTEAAAATAVMMFGAGMPQDPKQVKIDHPFLFVIRDKKTDAPLFIGRVNDPR